MKSYRRGRSKYKNSDRIDIDSTHILKNNKIAGLCQNLPNEEQHTQLKDFSDNELALKIELLKNFSLTQITNYIQQQQVSQSSTRFIDQYQYDPSLPSSK